MKKLQLAERYWTQEPSGLLDLLPYKNIALALQPHAAVKAKINATVRTRTRENQGFPWVTTRARQTRACARETRPFIQR